MAQPGTETRPGINAEVGQQIVNASDNPAGSKTELGGLAIELVLVLTRFIASFMRQVFYAPVIAVIDQRMKDTYARYVDEKLKAHNPYDEKAIKAIIDERIKHLRPNQVERRFPFTVIGIVVGFIAGATIAWHWVSVLTNKTIMVVADQSYSSLNDPHVQLFVVAAGGAILAIAGGLIGLVPDLLSRNNTQVRR